MLIDRMSAHSMTDTTPLDLSNIDVVDRNAFRQTKLFASFCKYNFKRLLTDAKAELQKETPDLKKVEEIIRVALQIKPIHDVLVNTAHTVLTLFCGSDTELRKMEIVGQDIPKYSKLLADWAPKSPIYGALRIVQKTPNLKEMAFDKWLEAADFLSLADIVCPSPVIESSIVAMQEF